MMLRYSFNLQNEADAIESAVSQVLAAGYRTADILGTSDVIPLNTIQMTEKIIELL
ncbi:3-isopropylmalate dehydrogenase [bioreactor metagenome]|uniref:3-isopropylmalate dehydrogenase n=1 Tax=bioreactor metagenome TaxID=1076179 RepID=A0A645JIG6_9ZZZZ